jgi:hypothetical protein
MLGLLYPVIAVDTFLVLWMSTEKQLEFDSEI